MTKAEEVRELAALMRGLGPVGILLSGGNVKVDMDNIPGRAATALRAYADLLEEHSILTERLKSVTEVKDVLYSKLEKREIERDREERLLDDGWTFELITEDDRLPMYRWFVYGGHDLRHPDRATAAKLAEEEMNGK